jgi:hypothetical protein
MAVNLAMGFAGRTPLMLTVTRMRTWISWRDLEILEIPRRTPDLIIYRRQEEFGPLQHAVLAFAESTLFDGLVQMVSRDLDLSKLHLQTFQRCRGHGLKGLIEREHARRTG